MSMSRQSRAMALACVCAALTFVLVPQPVHAQAVYGSIFGTVTDPAGAAVPNAKVTITDVNKNVSFDTTTNESGNYSRTQLIPDTYQVSVEAPGFRTAVQKNIVVNADTGAKVDLKMEVGAVSEQVEVTAEAPMLKTDRSDVSTTFSEKVLEDLPSFDRNFQSFELLVPGTQKLGWAHASSENPQGSLQIMVNGQNFSGTGFQLDGTDNQDPILGIIVINPTLESVTEGKMTTQNYDAEFGLAIAGIVTAQTKSGTNDIHGSAFEFVRNNSPGFQTQARDPFNAAQNNGTPPVKWNQFGGSFGGKIKKDKLFYFGDVQITRRRTGSTVLTQVPTAKARTGDFSEYLQSNITDSNGNPILVKDTAGNMVPLRQNMVFDPATRNADGTGALAFAGNVIPQSRLSPQALSLLQSIPLPNAPTDVVFRRNFAGSGSEKFDTNQWNTRIDYFINEKTNTFGRYSWANFTKTAPGAFGVAAGGPSLDNINFAGTSDVRNQSLAWGLNHTFSPTLLSEFRFGFMRYRVKVLPNGLGTSPATSAGIPGLNVDSFFTSGMPHFDAQGDGELNFGYSLGVNQCNCPLDEEEQQFQWVNNNSKISGNHTLKFGVDLRYAMNLRVPSDGHRSGENYFAPAYTGYYGQAGAGAQAGLGLATFLLGNETSFSRYVSPFTTAAERQKRFFWYIQDTWRVTNKLTVNYGLRWEQIFPEKVNGPGRGGALDLSTGEIAVFGVGHVSDHGIVDMNWKNFAPRLGITYQITPKTVVRAGYGWSYSIGTFGSIFGHNVTQNPPVLANQSINAPNGFTDVFTLAQGPPTFTFPTPDANGRFPCPVGVNCKARPTPLRLPRVEAYNVTVQRQLTGSLSLEVGYVGNVGRHAFNGDGPNFNVNAPAFIKGLTDQNLAKPFYQKFGWTQNIDYYCNCATTKYDSMQVRLEKRFAHGYGLIGNYTLARGIQDAGDSYSFLYNRKLERGVNGFDRKHIVTVAQNFDVPIGRGRAFGNNWGRAADAVLGGWSLNGVTTWMSGLPFWPSFDGGNRPYTGPAGIVDKGTGDPYAHGGRNQWIVKGLGGPFLAPPDYTFGNYPYNGLRGPFFFQQDLSLFKTFKPSERVAIEIRAEAFNVFNHTNLGMPNGDVTSTEAGKITGLAYSGGDTSSGAMRTMQFGFHLKF